MTWWCWLNINTLSYTYNNFIMHAASILLLFGAFCQPAASFQPSSSTSGRFTSIQAARVSHHEADSNGIGSATTRRSFAEDLVKGSIGFSLANLASLPAYASGGATAGGAYLLSGGLDLWRSFVNSRRAWNWYDLSSAYLPPSTFYIPNFHPTQQNSAIISVFLLVWNHFLHLMRGEIFDECILMYCLTQLTCILNVDVPPFADSSVLIVEIWTKWMPSLSQPMKEDGKIWPQLDVSDRFSYLLSSMLISTNAWCNIREHHTLIPLFLRLTHYLATDLLANAFRTTSTKAPDALPSVKKWKAFAKEIELVKRALSKKDSEKVFTAYKSAEETLDAYLDAVELPSGMELKKM